MPQMSPLSWAWMMIFIVFSYFLFFILFFFLAKFNVSMGDSLIFTSSRVYTW